MDANQLISRLEMDCTQDSDDSDRCFLCYVMAGHITDDDDHSGGDIGKSLISTVGNLRANRITETFCQFLNLPTFPYESLLKDERLIYCSTCVQQLRKISSTWTKLKLLQAKIVELRNSVENNLIRTYHHEQSADCAENNIPSKQSYSVETRKKIIRVLKLIPESPKSVIRSESELSENLAEVEVSTEFRQGSCPEVSNEIFKEKKEVDEMVFGGTSAESMNIKEEIPDFIVESGFQENDLGDLSTRNFSVDFSDVNIDEDLDLDDPLWSPESFISDSPSSDIDLEQDIKPSSKYRCRTRKSKPAELTGAMKEIAIEEILTGKKQLKIIVEKLCWNSTMDPSKVWTNPTRKNQATRKTKRAGTKGTKVKKPKEPMSKTEFSCPQCSRSFESNFKLLAHIRRAHQGNKTPYKCDLCDRGFAYPLNLERHKLIHEGQQPFICDQCGKTFNTPQYLRTHSMTVHQMGNVEKLGNQCSFCSKYFVSPGTLTIHLRTHTGEKPYKCQVSECTKYFRKKPDLVNHQMRNHSTELQLSQDGITCKVCSQKFYSASYARHHEKLHKVGREIFTFQCDQCPFRAPTRYRIRHHQLTHTTEKNLHCTFKDCTESFRYKARLNIHMKKHLNDRGYKCTECDKAFFTKNNLSHHIAAVHNANSVELCEKHKCQHCGQGFPLRKYLVRHLKKHEEGKLPAPQPSSVGTSSVDEGK